VERHVEKHGFTAPKTRHPPLSEFLGQVGSFADWVGDQALRDGEMAFLKYYLRRLLARLCPGRTEGQGVLGLYKEEDRAQEA
jgi:hypothetical protein